MAVYSSHNVYSQGSGVDICMDHHGSAPNNNLWTDIDLVSAQVDAPVLHSSTYKGRVLASQLLALRLQESLRE